MVNQRSYFLCPLKIMRRALCSTGFGDLLYVSVELYGGHTLVQEYVVLLSLSFPLLLQLQFLVSQPLHHQH